MASWLVLKMNFAMSSQSACFWYDVKKRVYSRNLQCRLCEENIRQVCDSVSLCFHNQQILKGPGGAFWEDGGPEVQETCVHLFEFLFENR